MIKHTPALVSYLDTMGQAGQDPTLMIKNSPGGNLPDLLMIKDEFDRVRSQYGVKIRTIAVGEVGSAACDLVVFGDKGMRLTYPSTIFLLHDIQWRPHNPMQFESILARSKEATDILKQNRRIERELSKATGKPITELRKYYDRELMAHEALKLGLIDEIVLWARK